MIGGHKVMKVILLQDVKGTGKKNEVCEVSDGYARNFLLPKKLAIPANTGNINTLNSKKAADEVRRQKQINEAKEIAKKIEQISVIIKTKSGENGKLYGAITAKDVSEELFNQYGIDIDKKKIVLDNPIKTLGVLKVEAKVYPGIVARLAVKIEQE